MTERFEHLPGLSEREILEGLGAEALTNYITGLGAKASVLETKMNEAAEILEGVYGVTVDEVLRRRESRGETNNG